MCITLHQTLGEVRVSQRPCTPWFHVPALEHGLSHTEVKVTEREAGWDSGLSRLLDIPKEILSIFGVEG